MEKVFLPAPDNYRLSLAVFEAEKAKAVIQMIHGMEEHKERYYDFAHYLSENGFDVVISDLRGHGSDAPVLSHIADDRGDELLIADQQSIRDYIGTRFPKLPVLIFAHSMGTIIARVLLQTDSGRYAGTALSGYVNPNPASPVAVALGNLMRLLKGPGQHSSMLTQLALGAYARSIRNRKTDLDWLSRVESNIKEYIKDPLCGVEFTIGSYCALFRLLGKMGRVRDFRNVQKGMPILMAAGEEDPCTGGEKGRADSRKELQDAGFGAVSVITYENMRHEILNEKNQKVYEDILAFFKKAVS